MRKTATALLVVGLTAIMVSPALAATLMSDSFSYPDGNLVPNGTWLVYSGTPPTDIQIVSGRVVGSHANAPDDHALFAPQLTTDKTYACFNVTIPDPGGVPKAVYFAELKDGGASALVSRVHVIGLTTGGWTFAISHSSTSVTVGVVLWSTTSLVYGQEYVVAINYDPVAKTSSLWVDPVDESSPSVTITNAAVAALAVSGFGFRQSGTASTLPPSADYIIPGTANWTYSVDNLAVGTAFGDACTSGPTPTHRSTWGQLKTIYRQ